MRTPLATARFDVEVTSEHIEQFHEHGFVAVDRITTDEELDWRGQVWDDLFVDSNRTRLGGWYETSRPYGDTGAPRP